MNLINLMSPSSNNKLHVGIIPDGGRRWGKKNKVDLFSSYLGMVEKLEQVTEYAAQNDIGEISVYLSSYHNFTRNKHEIEAFCKAGAEFCRRIKGKYAIRFCGERELIPEYLMTEVDNIIKLSSNTNLVLNLLMAYTPLTELYRASKGAENISAFVNNLQISTPLNIVIRTGNAKTISNFLPVQSGFARLYFFDKSFNDFTVYDFRKIITDYLDLDLLYGN